MSAAQSKLRSVQVVHCYSSLAGLVLLTYILLPEECMVTGIDSYKGPNQVTVIQNVDQTCHNDVVEDLGHWRGQHSEGARLVGERHTDAQALGQIWDAQASS